MQSAAVPCTGNGIKRTAASALLSDSSSNSSSTGGSNDGGTCSHTQSNAESPPPPEKRSFIVVESPIKLDTISSAVSCLVFLHFFFGLTCICNYLNLITKGGFGHKSVEDTE